MNGWVAASAAVLVMVLFQAGRLGVVVTGTVVGAPDVVVAEAVVWGTVVVVFGSGVAGVVEGIGATLGLELGGLVTLLVLLPLVPLPLGLGGLVTLLVPLPLVLFPLGSQRETLVFHWQNGFVPQ